MLIAIANNWVICQVYCSQTIKLSVRSIAEVATDPERTGSDSDLNCFFADLDPVLLEDADQKLNLALPFQVIWRQSQHYITQRPFFFFWSPPKFWQKNAPIFSEDFFIFISLIFT